MFFYILIFLFILLIEILLLSTLKIEIKNLKISTEKYKGSFLDGDYKITISIWGLRKIRFINFKITKVKLEELKTKDKIKATIRRLNIEKIKKTGNLDFKNLRKIIKYIPKLEYIDLTVNIGLDDAILTSYIVASIASIIGLVLKKQMTESIDNKFIINPLYINKNLLNMELNCIFETKMIHIIYIIYILNKKGRVNKNVRTSNRRSYGYRYE